MALTLAEGTTLHDVLLVMQEYKVRRLTIDNVVIELSTEAFAPSWQAQTATPPPAVLSEEPPCRCGHHAIVAHNDAGLCLEGCNPEECRPVETT